jgi:hypothetical protein
MADARFGRGDTPTSFLDTFHYTPNIVEVVAPGLQTSVQARARALA